jgi:hypothetical protein
MTSLFEQKSTLAKLLAQENIIVEHRNVPTAYFDLKSRTMTLPFWTVMDGEIYDLLVGHEVGHAQYTPMQGWHDAVTANRVLKDYLNVIEDARIERKIKEKFPGLRRSFNLAYKQLHEQDFFALAGRDLSGLKLIDRINIFFKLGAHIKVGFNQDELKFIDRISAAESWEEVEAIANDVLAYAKDHPQEQKPNDESSDDEFDDSEESDGFGDSDESNEFDDEEFDAGDSESSDEDSDVDSSDFPFENDVDSDSDNSSDEDSNDDSNGSDDGDKADDDLKSDTDRAFRRNESKLVNNSDKRTVIANLPVFNDSYLVSYKKVQKIISDHITTSAVRNTGINELVRKLVVDFKKRTTPVINYMIKEFEMRKNASQLARGKSAKSGKINPSKLARFNLDQDIFKRITTVPQGQNHGMVIFIDLSGSMHTIIKQTFEQALLLAEFCRKTNIPFDIYGFSDNDYSRTEYGIEGDYMEKKDGDLLGYNKRFALKHYLSSSMTNTDYRTATSNMLFVGEAHNYYSSRWTQQLSVPLAESLNGTPLNEALTASIDVVSKFKSAFKLDIVNAIFLTDGIAGNFYGKHDDSLKYGYDYISADDTFYLQHAATKTRVQCKYAAKQSCDDFVTSRAIIEIAKKVTGAKYTGYYICHHKRDIAEANYNYEFNYVDRKTMSEQKASFTKNVTSNGFYSSHKFGFDEYFFVTSDNMKVEDKGIVVDKTKNNKGAISRAFNASLKSRGLQRMFLNKFVQNLAA